MHVITYTHQVHTDGHPPTFCLSEDQATHHARQHLPRSSSILVLRTHSRTGEQSWEFCTVVAPE